MKNFATPKGGFLLLAALLSGLSGTCLLAGTIGGGAGLPKNTTDLFLAQSNISAEYQGYFFEQSTGYTIPFDDPRLAGLGSNPGTFLLTENTFFSFTGVPVITIVSTNIDLGQGVLFLNDPQTTFSTFGFGSNGVPGVPEPRSDLLALTPLTLLAIMHRYLVRA